MKIARFSARDQDSHRRLTVGYLLMASVFSFILALGLLTLGLELSFGIAIGKALLITLGVDAAIFLIFKIADPLADSLFGMKKPVEREAQLYNSLRDDAEIKARSHEWSEAARLFHMLAGHPQNKSPEMSAYRLADIYANHLGRPKDAIYWYRKAMAFIRLKQPGDFKKHSIWSDLERDVGSLSDFLAGDESEAQQLLAEVEAAIQADQLEQAQSRSAELMRRFPDMADGWFYAGIVEARTGRPALAVERYREALARNPKHMRALFNFAAALTKQDRLLEAREIWVRYLEIARGEAGEADFTKEAEKILEHVQAELAL